MLCVCCGGVGQVYPGMLALRHWRRQKALVDTVQRLDFEELLKLQVFQAAFMTFLSKEFCVSAVSASLLKCGSGGQCAGLTSLSPPLPHRVAGWQAESLRFYIECVELENRARSAGDFSPPSLPYHTSVDCCFAYQCDARDSPLQSKTRRRRPRARRPTGSPPRTH